MGEKLGACVRPDRNWTVRWIGSLPYYRSEGFPYAESPLR